MTIFNSTSRSNLQRTNLHSSDISGIKTNERNLTNFQLEQMGTPDNVSTVLWRLSSTEERRELLATNNINADDPSANLSDIPQIERRGKATGDVTKLKPIPGKHFDEAIFRRWYTEQNLDVSQITIFTGGNDPKTGELNRVALSNRAELQAYVKKHFSDFRDGEIIRHYGTSWEQVAPPKVEFDLKTAKNIVESFRQYGLILDTEGLNKGLDELFGNNDTQRKQFEQFLVNNGLISLPQQGDMILLRDRSFGGQVYGAIREASFYLIETVSGTGELIVGAGKTAYDLNPVGLVSDTLRAYGVNIPEGAPSTTRGIRSVTSVVAAAGTVLSNPSVLIARHKQLAAQGRYGELIARSALDIVTLVTTLKAGANLARNLAAKANLGEKLPQLLRNKSPAELNKIASDAEKLASRLEKEAPALLKNGLEKQAKSNKALVTETTISSTGKTAPIKAASPKTGEQVFTELTRELDLGPTRPSTAKIDSTESVRIARENDWVDANGQGSKIPLAVEPHGKATAIRTELGKTGSDLQSAHIGPTSVLKEAEGYSRRLADTILLDPATHRAFDSLWKDWAQGLRRAGRTDCSVQELHNVMVRAIEAAPNLSQATKDAMIWKLGHELYSQLGLRPTDRLVLPYPNVTPQP